MTGKIITYWYVEPTDAHTNEVIAKRLLAVNQLDENFALVDSEGKEISVFQIEKYAFIQELYDNRQKFALRFKVYSRQGKNGKLKLWEFGEKKPVKKIDLEQMKGKNVRLKSQTKKD